MVGEGLNLRPLGPESGTIALHTRPGIACATKPLISLTSRFTLHGTGRTERTEAAGRDCKTTAGNFTVRDDGSPARCTRSRRVTPWGHASTLEPQRPDHLHEGTELRVPRR